MCGLQMQVTFVLLVALAVLGQCFGFVAIVFTNGVLRVAALVDVVAHEQHKVEWLLGYLCMRDELPLLVVLTRRQGDAQRAHIGIQRRCGTRVAHRAGCIPLGKAVPVVGAGLQVLHMHMHAVAARIVCDDFSFLHATLECGIGKHLDLHTQRFGAHGAVLVAEQ